MAAAFSAAYAETEWCGVYASTLARAIQTATPLAVRRGLAVEQRAGLAELDYGAWDGLSAQGSTPPIMTSTYAGARIPRGIHRPMAKRRWRSRSASPR